MGRKQDKKTKKRVTISLAEFNENAGIGGAHPEAAALPSAPKAPEQWEAIGGRPEYNSRGYKERTSGPRDRNARTDGDDEDWSRRGPLDNDLGFGGMSSERDWTATRREQPASEDAPERDWSDIRRGSVEAAHSAPPPDRDWNSRSGPVDSDVRSSPSEADWGSVRQGSGPVEAEFTKIRSFTQRNPIDSEMKTSSTAEADWNTRKGPVEAEFSVPSADRDWSARRGPVEANTANGQDWADVRRGASADERLPSQKDVDWSEIRHAPVGSASSNPQTETRPEVDWSTRRSPVKSRTEMAAARSKDAKEKQSSFDAVRGSKFRDLDDADSSDRGSWRRDSSFSGFTQSRGRGSYADYRTRPPSTSSDGTSQERDWSAARRSLPEALTSTHDLNSFHDKQESEEQPQEGASDTQPLVEANDVLSLDADDETDVACESRDILDAVADVSKPENDDEWTTVKANAKKVAQQARRQASGSRNIWRGRGGRDLGGRGGFRVADRGRSARPVGPGLGIGDETHVSPLTTTLAPSEP